MPINPRPTPTGREILWGEEEIIVSKTDLKGLILYANQTFLRIARYAEHEILGQPHSIIRHPDMPKCVFKLLWDTLEAGDEIFAFVKNMARDGDHYWVFAHVTPTYAPNGRVVGYHSNRRCPQRKHVELFEGIYAKLLAEEKRHADWREGMASAGRMLLSMVAEHHMDYPEFIFSV